MLLAFILACYGMTMIILYGKIFNKIRPDWELLKCSLCVGFWVGIFNSFLVNINLNFFVCGCISAGTSYILDKIIDDYGIIIKKR